MSVYKKIFNAVETAIFVKQLKTARDVSWFVSKNLGIDRVDENEIRKIIDRVATQYKQDEKA